MTQHLKVALGADHGGYELKQHLIEYLRSLGHTVQDCGTHGKDPVDYPTFAEAYVAAAEQLAG